MKVRVFPKCVSHCEVTQRFAALAKEKNALSYSLERRLKQIEEIAKLAQKSQIIALRVDEYWSEVIGFYGASVGDVYYYRIGNESTARGRMSLSDSGNGTVVLQDWHIFDENDKGYGSFFLSSVIAYLKRMNYRKVVGRISPVDFDHEKKLLHIYQKFGFTIKDYGDYKSIALFPQDSTSEAFGRKDVAEWLQILEGLNHSDPAEQLGLSKQQFEHVSVHPLFQQDLLHVATEIAQKYRWVGEYML